MMGSKSLINTTYIKNMSIPYNKVAFIKQEAVGKKVHDNSGVFIPSCITPFKNVFLAIVNTDSRMTSDNYMALRWPSFKKVNQDFL